MRCAENGAPGRIRTSDPQIRSLVLYPAELRAPVVLRAENTPGRQAPARNARIAIDFVSHWQDFERNRKSSARHSARTIPDCVPWTHQTAPAKKPPANGRSVFHCVCRAAVSGAHGLRGHGHRRGHDHHGRDLFRHVSHLGHVLCRKTTNHSSLGNGTSRDLCPFEPLREWCSQSARCLRSQGCSSHRRRAWQPLPDRPRPCREPA